MNKKLSLIVLAIVLAAATVLGQPREISKTEFEAIDRTAWSKLEKATYRVRTSHSPHEASKASEQGALTSSVSEVAPPDRRRTVMVWQTTKGTRTEETINVGNQEFARTANGPWRDKSKDQPNRFTIKGDQVESQETATYRYLGSESVKGVDTDLYEENVYREFKYPNDTMTFSVVNRIWVTKDGRFVKRESKYGGKRGVVTSYMISEYEYDSSIKIKVPSIKK